MIEKYFNVLIIATLSIFCLLFIFFKLEIDSRTTFEILSKNPLVIERLEYINDDYFSYINNTPVLEIDRDWEVYFTDGSMYKYEPDARPTHFKWFKEEVKYQIHNKKDSGIIDKEWIASSFLMEKE